MKINDKTSLSLTQPQRGFTLIELMIVVAIIGILAAITYPRYQQYVIKTKRVDMMNEMQNIASIMQSRKLAQGSYSNALKTGLDGNYPQQNPLYTVSITPDPLTSQWTITATPKTTNQMKGDGNLTLTHQGVKCRTTITPCTGENWN